MMQQVDVSQSSSGVICRSIAGFEHADFDPAAYSIGVLEPGAGLYAAKEKG
jgi:hypothetical protein